MKNYIKKKNKMTPIEREKTLFLFCFLVIPLFLLIVFTYYPMVELFRVSVHKWDGYNPEMEFVGLKNYINLFADKSTMLCFKNNLAYILVSFIQTGLAFYLALVLNGKIKGRKFFRTIIFLPYILNGVAVAFMFNYMYDFNEGPLNVLLRSISNGQWEVAWLGMGYGINFALAFIALWRNTGFNVVIFLGALQSIPDDYYEAATLDGAGYWQRVRYITIPHMKPIIGLNLFLSISGALQSFFEPFVLTKGGPGTLSSTFAVRILDVAFTNANFGKASAMSVVLFTIILIILVAKNVFEKNIEKY